MNRRLHSITRYVALSTVLALATLAQQPGQATFANPQAAADALFAATKAGNDAQLLKLFGPNSEAVVSSGDSNEDKASRQKFVAAWGVMHRLATEPDGDVTIYVGAENWPFPIPLVAASGKWYFDTAAGQREVVYRRIGHNEDAATQILAELVAAQKEYFAGLHDGATAHQYAQHFVSDAGKHNGLFWENSAGSEKAPIGALLAFASLEAQSKKGSAPAPYQGYYFHLLKAQGPNAPGGAKSYLVNGAMTGGFAFVAWPAEYRSSGVFTFLVGPDGVVYQKNLGPDGAAEAKAMTAFNPDASWQKVQP